MALLPVEGFHFFLLLVDPDQYRPGVSHKSCIFVSCSDLVIRLIGCFFPDGTTIVQSSHEAWGIISHINWPPQSSDLNPIKSLWDMLEKILRSGLTLHHQDMILAKNACSGWKANVATSYEVVRPVSRQMHTIIKYLSVDLCFGQRAYYVATPKMVCCGIWHQDGISRSFKSCKL